MFTLVDAFGDVEVDTAITTLEQAVEHMGFFMQEGDRIVVSHNPLVSFIYIYDTDGEAIDLFGVLRKA